MLYKNIEKALELCCKKENKCKQCPYHGNVDCLIELAKDSLDYIKHLNALLKAKDVLIDSEIKQARKKTILEISTIYDDWGEHRLGYYDTFKEYAEKYGVEINE